MLSKLDQSLEKMDKIKSGGNGTVIRVDINQQSKQYHGMNTFDDFVDLFSPTSLIRIAQNSFLFGNHVDQIPSATNTNERDFRD